MNSIITQQPQHQKDVVKILFLFAALGISAYATYRISKTLAQEITDEMA